MRKGVRPLILLGLLSAIIYSGFVFNVFDSHQDHQTTHSHAETSDHHSHSH